MGEKNRAAAFICAGVIVGAAFFALFVRVPRWLGSGDAAAGVAALLFVSLVFGGAYTAARVYDRYAARAASRAWDRYIARSREMLK